MKIIEQSKQVLLRDVKNWEKNPRKIQKADFERLKKQLVKFQQYKPLICYQDGDTLLTIAGNMRLRALKELGQKEVWVTVVEFENEQEKIEVSISDNDRAGYYDDQALAEMLYDFRDDIELDMFKVDLYEPKDDLLSILDSVADMGGEEDFDADDAMEREPKFKIVRGDLFEIGRHKLLCGDATSVEDVAKLMGGEKADLILTDPPYGINIVKVGGDGKTKFGKVGGDGKVKANYYSPIEGDDKEFDPRFLLNLADKIMIFGGNYYANLLPNSRCWLVWDKERNEGVTFADCELIWTNFDKVAKIYRCRWDGLMYDRKAEDTKSRIHPTQKPIKLLKDLLNDFTKKDDIVLDLFLGSGSTMVAAHQTGRRAYGCEIDEKYCSVIIERMLKLDPTLEVTKNGEKMDLQGTA